MTSYEPGATALPQGATGAGHVPEPEAVMGMLADRLPLSLIMDLAMPAGPHSDELLDEEGLPDGAWWESR